MTSTRNWLWGLVAVAIWLLCFYGQYRPAALGPGAPAREFSAARADAVLARLLGQEIPHPAGSPENAAVHARLLGELRQLGVKADTLHTMSCYAETRVSAVTCATITDIIGEIVPGTGPAIVLMAHTDSVAAGPGAGDDQSGVATILETIRAWKAQGSASRHPILALFTDGEENAMLGASAFLADPAWRARVGVVINLDVRGNQGRSFLFQTSPGDGALIDLYARGVPHLATSSLYAEIYKVLPNDTDLTPFLHAGFTGYNFAFVGDVAQYHTPRDRRANLDPRALQQYGESALGMVTMLAQTDFTQLKSGDAIYFDVLGRWLPRLPKSWALPLSLLAFAGIALAGWMARSPTRSLRQRLVAAIVPPSLLVGCVAAGFALHGLAALISGHADPSFAHSWALRLALTFGVWCVALLSGRLQPGVFDIWLWIAGLGVLAAALLPGFSPYFLFPSLIATVLLLATVRGSETRRRLATCAVALAGVFTWLNLAATSEAIMGLAAHPLFTVSAAFALMTLLPLFGGTKILFPALTSLGLAILFAVIAGFLPAFTHESPQRLNLRYVEDDGRAMWLADPVAHLPQGLRAAGRFGDRVEAAAPFWRGYTGAAGQARFPVPSATVTRHGSSVTVALQGSRETDGMMLASPAPFILKAVNGEAFNGMSSATRLICDTRDCAGATLTLETKARGTFTLVEMRRGLPMTGTGLLLARPDDAVPSGSGDQTLLTARIPIP